MPHIGFCPYSCPGA